MLFRSWELEVYGSVIIPPPVADFTSDITEGVAPLTVNFTDASTGDVTSWLCGFGDGVGTSTAQHPTYIYDTAGTYTVSLTVVGPGGSDGETKTDYITVTEPAPVADFTSDVTTGDAPLTVNFTDASSGVATSWSWDFGDTGTSIEEDPTYIYTAAGTYTVTLTVTGPGGSDDEIKTDYITVSEISAGCQIGAFIADWA